MWAQVVLPILGIGVSYAVAIEPHWIRPVTYDVEIPGLPEVFNGFSILHLSDLHGRVGVFATAAFKQWHQQCDMIAVTGDLYSLSLSREALSGYLQALSAPQGVYYVSGNHDYRKGKLWVYPWQPKSALLDNRTVAIRRGDDYIWLAGLPDLVKGQPQWETVQEAWARSSAPVILLSHRPDAALLPGAERCALVLSGHTHGGQVAVPGWGAVFRHNHLPGRYVAGYKKGRPTVITSRGLGTSELPIRFAARPEIVRIRLWAVNRMPQAIRKGGQR